MFDETRSVRSSATMSKEAMLVICALVLGTAANSAMASCVYDGKEYSDGAATCQSGTYMVCFNGAWYQRGDCLSQSQIAELPESDESNSPFATVDDQAKSAIGAGVWTQCAMVVSGKSIHLPGGQANNSACVAAAKRCCERNHWVYQGVTYWSYPILLQAPLEVCR